jgi:catechol 2,3-dioxygenase-like lactoylglutathione lyase family enzyme
VAAVKLEHIGIPATVENFDEVVGFYCDNFGWSVIRELGGPPRINFISDGSGGRLEVYVAEGPPMSHPSHLAFAVPIAEYDELRARLLDSGVAFDVDTTNAAGDKLAFFNDPAGNRAQIIGRLKTLPSRDG